MDTPSTSSRSASPAADWALDPTVTFLNHGSFGACPRAILEVQRGWRDKLEAHPVRFLARELEDLLDWARSEIGAFVGGDPDGLALMPNATAGLSTVLRSLEFERGDEIVITDHIYGSANSIVRFVAAQAGVRVAIARVPFPIQTPEQAFEAIVGRVTDRTRLAVIEHVTSPTALVFPIDQLVKALKDKGVDVLVDGAHGPGMVPLRLDQMAPAYYVGTLHKWVCAPKGSAFLWVRNDRQAAIKPLAISAGFGETKGDRSRFRLDFDWTGTFDPTAWLTVPAAIDGLGEMMPGGWPALMESNNRLAIKARDLLTEAFHTVRQAPNGMTGSMAAVRLPGGPWPRADALRRRQMIDAAMRGRRFEVPLILWPLPYLIDSGDLPEDTPLDILVRISAQAYNYQGQFERLASILSGFAGVNRPGGDVVSG